MDTATRPRSARGRVGDSSRAPFAGPEGDSGDAVLVGSGARRVAGFGLGSRTYFASDMVGGTFGMMQPPAPPTPRTAPTSSPRLHPTTRPRSAPSPHPDLLSPWLPPIGKGEEDGHAEGANALGNEALSSWRTPFRRWHVGRSKSSRVLTGLTAHVTTRRFEHLRRERGVCGKIPGLRASPKRRATARPVRMAAYVAAAPASPFSYP